MKMLTVRLPERIIADIEAASRQRNISRSDIVRERLESPYPAGNREPKTFNALDLISDLIGSVEGLPPDVGARKKHYLKITGYGKKRSRRCKLSNSTAQPR
jgi:hypothetical protein